MELLHRMIRPVLAASAAAIVMAACAPGALAATGHGLKKIHNPGRVTGTIHGQCHYRGLLPDPRCTPGSIDPYVTQADIRSTICRAGYTRTVRPAESQTERFKYGVAYPAYGTPPGERTELDHLVPLELGGSNDATNLWPEYPPTPNPKDKVENALNAAVCEGRVSLTAAQDAIAADWVTAEHKLGIGPVNSAPHKAWCTASASWNSHYGDYDITVRSDQYDVKAVATAPDGASGWWWTDRSGNSVIWLYGASGGTVKVTAGGASCAAAT